MKKSLFGFPLLASMAFGGDGAVMPRGAPAYNVAFSTPSFEVGVVGAINYSVVLFPGNAVQKDLDLLLLQSRAESDIAPSSANVVLLATIQQGICVSTDASRCATQQFPITPTLWSIKVGFNRTATHSTTDNPNNLFFCMASAPFTSDNPTPFDVCNFYSSLFTITERGMASSGGGAAPGILSARAEVAPVGPITVTSSVSTLFTLMEPQTTVTSPGTAITPISVSGGSTSIISTSYGTVTVSPTASSTGANPVVETTGSNETAKSSKPGLTIGAKVGIALGAIIGLGLILLAILFCLRRKHAKRAGHRPLDPQQPPEQVMLTRSMHTDSFGTPNGNGTRGIMAEKEEGVASAAVLHPHSADNSPIHPHETDTRHSAVAPYVPLPSLPYSGTATTVPRRKPTSATVASTVSRNISSASGVISPRSTATPGSEFSPYHDVPVYGDARHSPQVFQGGPSSPFVTEEMSPEEVARLEEEERRIDAAIAEAERR